MSQEDPRRAFHVALGASVLSHLASLPVKRRLLILLAMKGQEGFPQEQLLAAEDNPEALLAAAKELAAEGTLARRRHPDGRVFWAHTDPDPIRDLEKSAGHRDPARRRSFRANDGGPSDATGR